MGIKKDISEPLREHEEVIVAYLYGSEAKGTAHEGSDLDIGLLLRKDFEPDALYTSKVSRELQEKLGISKEIDVRLLNDKPIIFQHQVLKNGSEILTRDERARIDFETEVYDRYLDYKPFFDRYNEIRRKRLLA